MNAPLSGFSSNLTPDYSKETSQVQIKKGISEGSSDEKGVILTKDSLEVPFERQVKIASQEAEAGRPSLPPLFRSRFVEDREGEDASRAYYLALRAGLPPLLKEKLERNERALSPDDRDPDFAALDGSLKFEARLLALTDTLAIAMKGEANALQGAEQEPGIPLHVQEEISTYGAAVGQFLERYLSSLGRNDPGFEALLNVSNQIKEALSLLNQKPESSET